MSEIDITKYEQLMNEYPNTKRKFPVKDTYVHKKTGERVKIKWSKGAFRIVGLFLILTACSNHSEQYAYIRNDTLVIQIKNPSAYEIDCVQLEQSSKDSAWVEYFKLEEQ
jgi:hypothetical protein